MYICGCGRIDFSKCFITSSYLTLDQLKYKQIPIIEFVLPPTAIHGSPWAYDTYVPNFFAATASLLFQHAIHSVEERIWIASSYFVPDDGIIDTLQLAGMQGIDVRILIPDKPDHLLVYMAAFAFSGKKIPLAPSE